MSDYVYQPYPKFVGTKENYRIVHTKEEEDAWYLENPDQSLPEAPKYEVIEGTGSFVQDVVPVKRKYTRRLP